MQIFFCEVCGHRVSDVEIERGECRQVGEVVYCKNCIQHAPPEPAPRRRPGSKTRQRPASGSNRPVPPRHPRDHRETRTHAPVAATQQKTPMVFLAIALGVSVASIIVIVAVLSRKPSRRRSPRVVVPQVQTGGAQVQPVAGVKPVKEDDEERFARLGLESADRYAAQNAHDLAGVVARYESVAENYPGTTYAEKASDKAYGIKAKNAQEFARLAAAAAAEKPAAKAKAEAALRLARFDVSPTVDGKLDDWERLPFECATPAQVAMSKHTHAGPADAKFSFGVGFTGKFVYVGVDVTDDKVVSGERLTVTQQDGVEIRIDARPNAARRSGRGERPFVDFLPFALSPQDEGPCYVANRSRLPEGAQAACAKKAGGYTAEIALPAKYLDETQKEVWHAFRLNVAVSDFDGEARNRNEAARIFWKPDWASKQNVAGSGTFVRRTPMKRLAHTPRIDGNVNDWGICVEGGPLAVIDREEQYCNGKKELWTGPEDLSARIYTGWTDRGLYASVEVTDDVYVVDPIGEHPWNYDCVEFFFDVRAEEEQEEVTLTPGSYQVCVSPAERPGMEPRWKVYPPDGRELVGFAVQTSRTPKGYIMEVKIPTSDENVPAGGWGEGRAVRFAVIVNDKDDPESKGRDYCFGWATSPGGHNFRDTSGWRRMYLER